MAILLKTASVRVSSFKSCKLESETRAKVFGKVDTTETYHTSIKMLKEVMFPRFGVPRYLMTDGGSHFIHSAFRKMLAKYDVNHRIASPYHPQSSGQVELSNRELKLILQKNVNRSRKNWSK